MVGPIGLGTVKLGRTTGLKYPTAATVPTDAEAMALLDRAAGLGVSVLDTAPAYGASESRLGGLLASRGDRERWVLCTKAGEVHEAGESRYDFTPEAVIASAERSVLRLRAGVIDVLLIHSDGAWEVGPEAGATLDALDSLRSRGVCRATGVSAKTSEGARLAIRRCDVVMVTLNRREPEMLPVIGEACAAGVGVMVKKAMASGHDAGPGAVAWAASASGVGCVVVGTTNPEHLASAVREVEASAGSA